MDAGMKAVYEEIIEIAKNDDVITYSELASRTDNAPTGIGPILDRINNIERCEGRPMLSAVVISKSRNIPGAGFFKLAKKLGLQSDDEGNVKFWLKEIRRVHDYWGEMRRRSHTC